MMESPIPRISRGLSAEQNRQEKQISRTEIYFFIGAPHLGDKITPDTGFISCGISNNYVKNMKILC